MCQPVAHGTDGGSDVDHGDESFQFVVTRLVEKVGQADHSCGLADKICRQARRGAAEAPNQRIQFPSTALQISASDGEVSTIQRGCRNKQYSILRVPELVLDGICFLSKPECRSGFDGGSGRFGKRSLRKSGRRQNAGHEQGRCMEA